MFAGRTSARGLRSQAPVKTIAFPAAAGLTRSMLDALAYQIPAVAVGGADSLAAFLAIAERNPSARMERSASGDIRIMPPTGSQTGNWNSELLGEVYAWNRAKGRPGYGFDAMTAFVLPDNSTYMPDVAWIAKDRYEALPEDERRRFPRIAPDFVIELASPSDDRAHLREKMDVYMQNGVRLAFLIDPDRQNCFAYRAGEDRGAGEAAAGGAAATWDVEAFADLQRSLSGGDVMPGLELDLRFLAK